MSGNRARLSVLSAAALAVVAAVSGCSSSGSVPGPAVPEDGALVRAAAVARPVVPQADLTATADGTAAFGFDMLRRLAAAQGDGNIMVSPASLATALGMVLPGARGQTAAELQKALHTSLTPDRYADALGALDAAGLRHAAAGSADAQQFDSLWTQQGFGVAPGYLGTLSRAFDTGVHQVDFAADPERARGLINQTVQDQTRGLIRDLFPSGTVSGDTRLVLTDALYLKAKWASPFPVAATLPADFTRLDGSVAQVPMMAQTEHLSYARGAGWQLAEVPYQGGQLAMDVVLPDAGTFGEFRDGFDGSRLASMLAAATDRRVALSLPKFTFDSGASVREQLRELGVRQLFDNRAADLSGIPADHQPLVVGAVVEKTHVAVDEQGTTAAAAAGVGIVAGAAPEPPQQDLVELRLDRPFLFLVRDTATGHVLFLGQVTAPVAGR